MNSAQRKNRFFFDPLVIEKILPFLNPNAFKNSGFDRGHMAPSGDFKWDQAANWISPF